MADHLLSIKVIITSNTHSNYAARLTVSCDLKFLTNCSAYNTQTNTQCASVKNNKATSLRFKNENSANSTHSFPIIYCISLNPHFSTHSNRRFSVVTPAVTSTVATVLTAAAPEAVAEPNDTYEDINCCLGDERKKCVLCRPHSQIKKRCIFEIITL
jgi:hypothetical protein